MVELDSQIQTYLGGAGESGGKGKGKREGLLREQANLLMPPVSKEKRK